MIYQLNSRGQMIPQVTYRDLFFNPSQWICESFVTDEAICLAIDGENLIERERERIRRKAARAIELPAGKSIVARLNIVEYRDERNRLTRLRGYLDVMDSPYDPKPMRVLEVCPPECIEVEKPAEEMPAGTLVAGLTRKFWGHLKSMTQELEYDGPRG